MTAPRLTANEYYGTDARMGALCDGDRYLSEAGRNSRYGGRFMTLRAWAGRIPNPLYVPAP